MMDSFDKQITLRMGQANVRHRIEDILPVVSQSDDPLGVEDLTTDEYPLNDAPKAYIRFERKHAGCVKVVLRP